MFDSVSLTAEGSDSDEWWSTRKVIAAAIRSKVGGGAGCRINEPMRHIARDLSDDQWKVLDPLIPTPKRRNDGRGRPWKSRRSVLNGILWMLRTGAPWADLPEAYPSFQTCHRRFQQWVRSGVMKEILEALASHLKLRGAIEVREAFIDASFAPAKKEALKLAKPNAVKGTKIMAPWQIATVCQYPFASKAPRRTK